VRTSCTGDSPSHHDMSTTAAKKKLVICGGNGFLGSRICKAAVARDWEVTSIRWVSYTNGIEQP